MYNGAVKLGRFEPDLVSEFYVFVYINPFLLFCYCNLEERERERKSDRERKRMNYLSHSSIQHEATPSLQLN